MQKPKFEDVYDFQNLFNAYKTGISNIATYKRYRKHVTDFTVQLEENLIELQNDLIWHTYELGNFFNFCVYEPKKREIAALPFRDRVVQIALCNIIEPYIDARFINESCGCRKNKGTLFAARRAVYYMHKPENTKYLVYYHGSGTGGSDMSLPRGLLRERQLLTGRLYQREENGEYREVREYDISG